MSHSEVIDPVDRKGWGAGPWDGEPDRLQWRTEAGLVGLVVRNSVGVLCGYVGLPPGHPQYGVTYGRIDADVHGGLTYSNFCSGGICHVPDPGEPERVWWVGFDTAHGGDLVPGFRRFSLPNPLFDGQYRDITYVRLQVESLAAQLRQ
jgi:hypothetical protein